MRNFVIGDLHGSGLELKFFLKEFQVKPGVDKIYLVGDLFDRGSFGHVVWDIIQEYNIQSTRGNHEQKYLNYLNGKRNNLPPHYIWALNNLISKNVKLEDFYNYLNSTPLLINLNNYIITHAGVVIDNPLQINESANVYGNTVDGSAYQTTGFPSVDWWDLYDGDYTVLYGHISSQDGKPRYRYNSKGQINSIGLDSATVHGGNLTAYCLEDQKVYTYCSGKDYFTDLKKEFQKNNPIPCNAISNWLKENGNKNFNTI